MKYVVYIVCLFLESILSCFFPFRIPLCLLAVLWGVKKGDYVFPIVTGFLYDFSYTGFYFLTSVIYLVLYVIVRKRLSLLTMLMSFLTYYTLFYIVFVCYQVTLFSLSWYIHAILSSFLAFVLFSFVVLLLQKKNKHKLDWRDIYG